MKDWFKWLLLILVIGCLISFFFIYKYAHSEGLKCLSDPLKYAYDHGEFNLRNMNFSG